MKDSDRFHLQQVMDNAALGKLTRSDAIAIFILVRGDAPVASMLRDVGHCIAHDKRDRGSGFVFVQGFIEGLHDGFVTGGSKELEVGIMFEVNQLLSELVTLLQSLGVRVDRAQIMSQSGEWAAIIASVLDGTEFETELATARLGSGFPWSVDIEFKNDIKGVLPLRKGITIGFSLLEPIKI